MTKSKIKEKHIPIRTCIGTGEKRPKKELIRIVDVKTPEDDVKENLLIDLRDKLSGRGANLLPNVEALESAIKKKAFERAFKRKIRPDEIQYHRENFTKAIEEKNFRPNNKPVIYKVEKN